MAPGSPTHRPSDLRDRFFVPSLSACCFLFLSCSPLASFTPLFFSFGSFSLPNSLRKPLFSLLAAKAIIRNQCSSLNVCFAPFNRVTPSSEGSLASKRTGFLNEMQDFDTYI